jgi:hypothetical protein
VDVALALALRALVSAGSNAAQTTPTAGGAWLIVHAAACVGSGVGSGVGCFYAPAVV